jgi:hypothetical protein
MAEATILRRLPPHKLGQRRGAMNDAQRYRLNAAECLLATKTCRSDYRGLTLSIASCWQSLAVQDELIDELLRGWGVVVESARDRARRRGLRPMGVAGPAIRRALSKSTVTTLRWVISPQCEQFSTAAVPQGAVSSRFWRRRDERSGRDRNTV